MDLDRQALERLGQCLTQERKRQGLTRTQVSAICNVSESFVRDAESHPGNCTLSKLLQLVSGLGLSLSLSGWQEDTTAGDSARARAERPPTARAAK